MKSILSGPRTHAPTLHIIFGHIFASDDGLRPLRVLVAIVLIARTWTWGINN